MPSNISCSSAFTSAPPHGLRERRAPRSRRPATLEDRGANASISVMRRTLLRPLRRLVSSTSRHWSDSRPMQVVLRGGRNVRLGDRLDRPVRRSGSSPVRSPTSSAMDLGGLAIKAALERAGVGARAGRLRAHGPGAPGRSGSDHRPPGRGQGGHPDDRAGDDRQQGVPLRHQRDLPRRPDDPGRRRRGRGRRRHGVDDQRALPAARARAPGTAWATASSSTR